MMTALMKVNRISRCGTPGEDGVMDASCKVVYGANRSFSVVSYNRSQVRPKLTHACFYCTRRQKHDGRGIPTHVVGVA